MARQGDDFRRALAARKILFFDGGLGTMLQSRGLPPGVSPEEFCLARPEVLKGIHADYYAAGADIVSTGTFGGSAFKLPQNLDAVDFNRRMAAVARQAAEEAGRKVYVAGSVGPGGKFLAPLGDVSFREMVRIFADQIRGLAQGGADFIHIETQIDLAEARAAVIAARSVCDLPVSVSMTYEDGVTLTGSSPEVCAATLANLGVDALGTNCSAGPEEMRGVVARLLAASPLPVLVEPNAGLPELEGENTVFRLGPEAFAEITAEFVRQGVLLPGGCCGTRPEHIAALRARVEGMQIPPLTRPLIRPEESGICLTSRSLLTRIGPGREFCLIGERINPTGKKKFTQELQEGETATALRFAAEQIEAGARVLDVNVGAPLVDEVKTLPRFTALLAARHPLPLSLDSSNPEAIRAALEEYPASPLVNSISGEAGRMESLGPICRDFGAPFILLPLRGKDLPVRCAERVAILEALLEEMDKLRIPRGLAMADALVLSVSANPEAGRECLEFIRYCTEKLHLPTVAGLSNVSFGLPARELVNASFLTLAAGAGLCAAIANPGNARVREAIYSTRLLLGQDPDAASFIANFAGWTSGPASSGGGAPAGGTPGAPLPGGGADGPLAGGVQNTGLNLRDAVIKGRREEILPLLDSALAQGLDPFDLVNAELIPGITEVGVLYERKEYFLPQLLRSAETMQAAFARLKPLLERDSRAGQRHRIVVATVEGDIHDIGKNIVSLMLGNHGFEVIDLGKDVCAARIVEEALANEASLIGLSALMTTTMVRMRDTLELLKEKGLEDKIKVMVGGAVVTRAFAESIGAHGYSKDAVEAVRVAGELVAQG